jgi:sulfate permease, SulP family
MMPLFQGVRAKRRDRAVRDALAGITLASMNIPQVLGYTRIAGTPVVTGLYTVFLPLVAFAVFGSSRHLVVAADSATATIFASGLAPLASAASETYMALVGMVALLTATFLLAARLFRLGFLSDFLSRTVLVGFLAGVGVQVGIAMVPDMLGMELTHRRAVLQVWEMATNLATAHAPTFALSALIVGGILIFRRVLPRFPAPLFAVLGTIAASAFWDLADHGIAVIGPVPGGLPAFTLPIVTWTEFLTLIPIAGSCFVIIIAQSAATARGFALLHRERVDEDADILGLAAANAAAALSGAFVVNGSPTQTAMAERAGARSQLAQLVFAGVVLLVLLFLTSPLQYLPRCVLAGIVFTIAVGMVDLQSLRAIRKESPGEFRLAVVTAAVVALAGVEQGILLAVALSLLRHVRHSYRPHTSIRVPDGSGRWEWAPAVPGTESAPGLIVYHFGADLFYANDSRFTDEVRALVTHAPTPVRRFVVDAGAITDLDYSAARTLTDLHDDLVRRGVTLVFGRASPSLRADMDRHGLTQKIGAENICATLHEALPPAKAH